MNGIKDRIRVTQFVMILFLISLLVYIVFLQVTYDKDENIVKVDLDNCSVVDNVRNVSRVCTKYDFSCKEVVILKNEERK